MNPAMISLRQLSWGIRLGILGLGLVLTSACRTSESKEPEAARPIVSIPVDGTVWVKGEKYYDPSENDGYAALGGYLAKVAERGTQSETPLLIQVEMSTPAKYIKGVLDACGKGGLKVWKLQIVAPEKLRG